MKIAEKTFLQFAVAIGGLVPVTAGLMGIIAGPSMVGDVSTPVALNSHFSYLSGLLLGISLGFWSCIPQIEKYRSRFQLLSFIVIIGGLGRLWSLIMVGIPDHAMLFGLVMELAITPLLALWQYRISRA